MSQAVLEPSIEESAIAPEPPKAGGIAERKRTLLIWGGAVALVVLLVFGVRYLIWSVHHETTDDAYLAGHLHPISARITDTVQQVLIDDNQHVVEGQTLVILDPNDYKVRLDQAKAALDAASRQADTAEAAIRSTSQSATAQTTQAQGSIGEAKASIQASKAAVTAAEAGVPRADAQLQEANATLQREETDLHRYQDLYAKEQVSKTNPRSPARELSGRGSWTGGCPGTSTTGAGATDRRSARRCSHRSSVDELRRRIAVRAGYETGNAGAGRSVCNCAGCNSAGSSFIGRRKVAAFLHDYQGASERSYRQKVG